MKWIDPKSYKRAKHFAFFNGLDYPHFNITVMLDIARLLPRVKEKGYSIFRVILYYACRAANDIPEFRQRIRGDKIVEHDSAHPSYTSMTNDGVFSFTDVQYEEDMAQFFVNCERQEELVKGEASLEDEAHRDDYLFVSSLPWMHFTSFVHPVHISGLDSVPRLTWGKYQKEGERIALPFSVQIHHALADGSHVGEYFKRLQAYFDLGLENEAP